MTKLVVHVLEKEFTFDSVVEAFDYADTQVTKLYRCQLEEVGHEQHLFFGEKISKEQFCSYTLMYVEDIYSIEEGSNSLGS